jgi:hypothetical protein
MQQLVRKSKPPRGTSDKTDFSLFIIESLEFDDEREGRLEGEILKDLLNISRQGINIQYIYIRTWREFTEALRLFIESNKRYLHISCHGNTSEIALTLDTIPFEEFGDVLAPYVNGRRLFFSACGVVNEELASAVIKGSGCFSLIGPKAEITFGNAAIMWASFYHLMFRDEKADAMKGGKIRWALRRIHYAFGEEFNYFNRANNSRGYEIVDANKR